MRYNRFVLFGLLLLFMFGEAVYGIAPREIKLERASYRKITISWQVPDATTQIASYKIFRNDNEIATTSSLAYTDESVQPGTSYAYKVVAVIVGGGNSEFSTELPVKTMKSAQFSNSLAMETVADAFHDTPAANLNAVSLLSGVKAGLEALLGSSISFSIIDEAIVTGVVVEELAFISAVAPELTEAERLAAQSELNTMMDESFSGNSFDHMYINVKLTQLGDKHWEAGNKVAAKMFYEFSLNYLSNDEATVFNTLFRLAYFSKSHLSKTSSGADISSGLSAAKDHLSRFSDFFPTPTNTHFAKMALSQPPQWFFFYFPKMLEYSNYDALFFANAQVAAQASLAFDQSDDRAIKTLEKVSAWELINLQVRFLDENGNPRSGSVKICNTSVANGKKYLFPGEPFSDERVFTLSNGSATVPVYAGHDYNATLEIDVPDGTKLIYDLPEFHYGKNKTYSYDYLNGSATDTVSSQSRVDFVISSAGYPYNLRIDRGIDVFDLHWDWTASANFDVAYFKVFRGNTVIETAQLKSTRLPLSNSANEYIYRVVAYDVNNTPSASSRTITVFPGDQSQYGDFFEWMNSYFGDQDVYSYDDSDGDGVDNYHEFLNGTDPTKVPGPTPYAGPCGFNELTLEWATVSDSPDAQYQISRNGAVVGTASGIKFTDTNLIPGTVYTYKVKLVAPVASATDWSLPNTLGTQRAHGYVHADKVQQIVDSFIKLDILSYAGTNLISAVKSGLEALTGTTITFTVIDRALLEKMVDQELAMLNEISPSMTTAERIAAKSELKQIMDESWAGNSFEEMYINSKLAELAEAHWQEYINNKTKLTSRTAALELYEASLLFLTNHESTVSNTLFRMGNLYLQSLDENSTDAEVKNALDSARDTMLRIYGYFPTPSNEMNIPYRKVIADYWKYFPRLLTYDNYDQMLFDNVMQLATTHSNQDVADVNRKKLLDKVAIWKLTSLTVNCGDANGTLTIKNTSSSLPETPWFSDSPLEDIRIFNLDGNAITIPVYAGHLYEITLKTPVLGGADWIRVISNLKFGSNLKITDDPFVGQTIENLPENNGNSELILPVRTVDFPYNLMVEKFPDVFNLSWEYVPLSGTSVDHYNIYRGNNLVATAQLTTCLSIPREVYADSVYTYSVSAVDAAGFESPKSPIIQVLPSFTEVELQYFEWKQNYFGNTPSLATDDPDGDGLSNYQEFLLGSNPTVAPTGNPKDSISNIFSGGLVKYYSGTFTVYPDFSVLMPYKTGTITEIHQPSTTGEVLQSERSDQVALNIRGYFDITQSGNYRFYLSANGGAELTIDKAVLFNFRNGGSKDGYVDIFLTQGTHRLELGYFKKAVNSELRLSWAGPEFSRKAFGSALWHTADDEAILDEVMSWQKDSDFDGIPDHQERRLKTDPFNPDTDGDNLTDYEEVYVYFTNPLVKDTDGDGIDDYEEVKIALSNPLVADFSGEPTVHQTILGKDFASSSSGWYRSGDSVDCLNRGGWINYQLQLPSRNVFLVELTGKDAFISDTTVDFDLVLEVAGVKCQAMKLISVNGEAAKIRFYLPLLPAGNYSAKLIWNNIDQNKRLRVDQLRLLFMNGPDTSNSGRPDWIDHRLMMLQKSNIPSLSVTSPLCVEGMAGVGLTDILVSAVAENNKAYSNFENKIFWLTENAAQIEADGLTLLVPTIFDGVKNKFYTNVELSPNIATSITISQNGEVATQSVSWASTNVLSTPTITIRRGDALLLEANQGTDTAGSAIITIGNEQLTVSQNDTIPYQFKQTGTFSVFAEFTPQSGDVAQSEMVVKVVDASFAGVPYSIVGVERNWNNAGIPQEAVLEYDDQISVFRNNTVTGANISFYGRSSGRANIVARLGEDGPIMAATQISILDSSTHKSDGYYKVIETFDDGSKLIEGKIILSEVPSDLSIRLAIYTTGTTFLDGTIVKILTAADFDENGVCRYQMLKSAESPTSTCHGMNFYQGNTLLFSYRNW